MKKLAQSVMILTSAFLVTGCSAKQEAPPAQPPIVQVVVEEPVRTAPGVVEYVWEEPMTDVIDVPPGLDPEGIYYRPAHQSIVEIRQGRWKYYNPQRAQ